MSTMTEQRNKAQEQAESYRETLEEIWSAIDAGRPYGDEGEARYGDLEDGQWFREFGMDEWGQYDGDESIDHDTVVAVADGNDAREHLDQLPLEIVWEKGEPFAVVLGTGGPHTEITGGGRASGSGYELWSYWGGDRGVVRGEAVRRTGEYFRELVESTEA